MNPKFHYVVAETCELVIPATASAKRIEWNACRTLRFLWLGCRSCSAALAQADHPDNSDCRAVAPWCGITIGTYAAASPLSQLPDDRIPSGTIAPRMTIPNFMLLSLGGWELIKA